MNFLKSRFVKISAQLFLRWSTMNNERKNLDKFV